MSLISNLIARLSLDSTAFDEGAAKSRQSLHGLMSQSLNLQKTLVSLAGTYLGARGIISGFKSVTSAAMDQQAAQRSLAASLSLTGDATQKNLDALKAYAKQLQNLTIYGDEEIVNQIAYAKSMGLSTDRIGEATIAAIGLASAYKKDLGAAFKYITLASKGETGQLKEMGIVIDKNLSVQGKYNELIRQMTEKFGLATDATRDAAGAAAQFLNTWQDTKALIGEGLLPTLQLFFQDLNKWLQENQGAVKRWASDFRDGVDIIRDSMNSLTPVQENLREMFEQFGPSTQKKITQAYETQTGKTFGYGQVGTETSGTTTKFFWPEDETYARRLMEGYRRSIMRGPIVPEVAKTGIPSINLTSAQPTPIGGDGASESHRKATMDIAAAYRRMYNDIDKRTQESHQIRRDLLQREYFEYVDIIEDKTLLNKWFDEQSREIDIEMAKSSQDIFEGWKAGFEEMKRDLETLGQLGAEEAKMFRDGVVDSLTDAVMESKNLGDSLKEIAREMAKMAVHWIMNQIVTSAMSSIFPVGVKHGGGIIGESTGLTRRISAAAFAGAPRLHGGLASDEFPAILQRGERVQSRASVGGDNRLMGEMVSLLRQLVAKPSANVAVVQSREEIYAALRSRDGQKVVAELMARNS